MTNIKRLDMLFLDKLFEMEDGYVLNFSDRTMAEFFDEELSIDIDDPIYAKNGGSKAKRLRTFFNTVDKPTVVRVVKALWDYRQGINEHFNREDALPNAEQRLAQLISILQSAAPESQPVGPLQKGTIDQTQILALMAEFQELFGLDPQPRGYAFEKFLKSLFDAYGLEAREAFRLRGEQIDGSFLLDRETYLLEAKWQSAQTAAQDLLAFNGRLGTKASWTRGLFISYSGFTEDGLHAVGRGNKFICMDGADLHEILDRQLPLDLVLQTKVRRAAETGQPFIRARNL